MVLHEWFDPGVCLGMEKAIMAETICSVHDKIADIRNMPLYVSRLGLRLVVKFC